MDYNITNTTDPINPIDSINPIDLIKPDFFYPLNKLSLTSNSMSNIIDKDDEDRINIMYQYKCQYQCQHHEHVCVCNCICRDRKGFETLAPYRIGHSLAGTDVFVCQHFASCKFSGKTCKKS